MTASTPGPEAMDTFVAVCHRVAEYGLVRCSSGNLSWRVAPDTLLISASRSWLETLTPEQVCVCNIATGALLRGPTPSVETRFHAGILDARPDVQMVLHFQTPHATALACTDEQPDLSVIPEIPYYLGPAARVPFLQPGSRELADAVIDAMRTHDLAFMVNHGLVIVGKDANDVIQKAVFTELACEIIDHAGDRLQRMPAESIASLTAAGRQSRGVGNGSP